MPVRPVYFHRLPEAIAVFERSSLPWVDRRQVEETLGVSKTVAWRILRKCGASEGPGKSLVCRRDGLVQALRQLLATGECDRELRRRARVEQAIEQLARLAHSLRAEVAENQDAERLRGAAFQRLPEGVELTPNRLTIDFQGTRQFLQRFGAVVFALQNDYEAVAAYLEPGPDHSSQA